MNESKKLSSKIHNHISDLNKKLKKETLSPISKIYINQIYTIALRVSLLFLIFGIIFILFAGHLSKLDTIGYIQTATEQIKFAIEEHIDEEFNTLMTAAILIEKSGQIVNIDTFDLIVQSLADNNSYIMVGIADKFGNAICSNKKSIKHTNLSTEPFIISALSGNKVVTETKRVTNGKGATFYAVPITDETNGTVLGVFFAADPEDELRNIINHSLYAGKGLAHLIDNKGNYIVRSNSPLVLGVGTNIFDLKTPLDKTTEQKIRSNLEAGMQGYLGLVLYNEKRLIAYIPLSINGWFIFYTVPENLVSAGIKNVIHGAIIVITVAALIFMLFIFLIRQINNNYRNAIETIAFIDPLTGHRNYQKFLIDARELLNKSKGIKYAICYSDIKGFKYINDFFGRDIGDRLLKYWSDFLYEISQEGEVYGHVSGDIFVSLRKYNTKQEIETRFESVARRLAVYPETFAQGYKAELYGGAYFIEKYDKNMKIRDMLDRAITAQREIKNADGSIRFAIYSKEMREQKLWQTEVESKMEAALENGEFHLFLQPKIDIQKNNHIMGAEALARWISPEKGLIPPNRFINIFEQNGFIIKLDRFIFETACKCYKEDVLDGELSPYILSVNVSRLGLMQPDFPRTYIMIKELYNIPDFYIELEFTESLVFSNHKLFQSIVSDCKRNGFLCSMDDFGSGYSSLNILKSIHVDILKLDSLFFKYDDNPKRGKKLVKNIIAMAKALDMKTVAEGVETENQVQQLRKMGCNAIQGYVFAKPMSIYDFRQFVKNWRD